MKRLFIYVSLVLFAGAFFTACTGDFVEINTNQHEATEEDLNKDNLRLGSFFTQMENHITAFTIGGQQDDSYGSTGAYQHVQGLSSDMYAGYLGSTGTWRGGNHNGCYNFSESWGNWMFALAFTQVMPAWQKMHGAAEEMNLPAVAALADILKVECMHRVTDFYGPIPYLHFGTGNIGNAYDSQQEIYNSFFRDLDHAIDVLTPYAEAGATLLADYDVIYKGDVAAWVRFANTLRLRLALRIVYADEALAKAEAEKSAANTIGFIEETTGRAQFNGSVFVNPIWEQAYAWNEQRMSAAMDSYLNGYKDPRLQVYFVPAAADGKYHGVRTGVVMSNNTNYIGDRISNVNVAQTTPVLYMAAAEAFFLRAEATLRGWDMRGTAKSFYENGIRLSMAEHGVNSGVDNYIADNTSKPANFVDRSGRNNGANTKSRITIAWEDNADFETNLERIITQKWIAGWPNSPEAWAEYRRTGYPYLFPVVVNNSNGTVDTELQIRRMPYPSTEYDTNADAVSTGVAQLGGPDTGGTRLWWDKKNH